MAEVSLTVVTQYVKTENLLQSTLCGQLRAVVIPETSLKPNIYFYIYEITTETLCPSQAPFPI